MGYAQYGLDVALGEGSLTSRNGKGGGIDVKEWEEGSLTSRNGGGVIDVKEWGGRGH